MSLKQLRLLFTFIFVTCLFFSSNAQNVSTQSISSINKITSGQTQTIYHFPPPFDDADFPFVTVEINDTTYDWARLLYDENPNILQIMDLHQAWRKNNPTVKNGHTRNYKKLIGYLMEHDAVNEDGFIDLPTSQEIKAQQKKILKDRKKFSQKNSVALRTSNNNTTWQNLGPFHMKSTSNELVNRHINIYAITQSISNPNILYCTSESGGTVYKSTDHGDNWFSVSDSLLTNMGPRDLEVAPTDPDILYLGTKHDIYKTSTGGNNWVSMFNHNSLDARTIIVHPTDADTLLAGTDLGIIRSTDGGQYWDTTFVDTTIYDLRYKTDNPQIVYALVNNSTTKQTDFYKSSNGGITWTIKPTGWPSAASIGNIGGRMTVSDGHPNIIYAFIGADWSGTADKNRTKIMKSSNAGESWTTVVDYNNSFGINSGQGYYDWDIEMSDVDSNVVYLGTQGKWVTKDGFATVNNNTGDLGHADVQEVLFNGTDLWVVNDGGVILFDDENFQNYAVKSTGINSVSYWSFDQGWNRDAQIGTHYHNGTSARTDTYEAGITVNFGGAEPSFSLVAQPNAEKVVSKGYGSVNGKTMPDDQNGPYGSFSYNIEPNQDWYDGTNIAVDLLHHNTHYAALGNAVMKSIDFGVTWDTLFAFSYSNEYVEVIELTRANTNVMYVGTTHSSGSSVYRSADGGASFVEMTSPWKTNNFHISTSNENENILFIGGDRKSGESGSDLKIAKTIDGGVTWIDLWTPMLDGYDFRKVMQVDGTNGGVYLLTTKAVFYRNNTMQDWEALVDGIPPNASLQYIKPFYKENKLRIATSRGVFGAELYETPQLANILLQPTVGNRNVFCSKDTVSFDDYSVVIHDGATWTWTFPGASYVSNANVRNPKVVYAQSGKYDVTISITKDGQTYTKTIEEMIEVGDGCDIADVIAGNAMKFNGTSSDRIQLEGLNATTNTFTISAWIKPDGSQNGFTGIVSNGVWCAHCNDKTLGLIYNYHADRLYYRWPNSTSSWSGNSGMYILQNEWSYVAMVMSPDKVTLYLNDEKWESNITHAPVEIPTLYIGDGHYSGFFKGNIDEVSIWNRSLTETEIKELMHLTKDPSIDPGLLAYYQFNEADGSAINKVGGAHGTIGGNIERLISTAPIGGGNSDTQNETSGSISFANSGLEINYTSQSGVEIVASKIDQKPYNVNGLLENDTPLDNQYWAVHRYGSGSYEADFTFTLSENLTTVDENAACRLALYGRENRSDEDWKFITSATSADANNNKVTFPVSDDYQQYLVARADQPIMRAIDFISLKNTLVGSISQEVNYEFTAANLINNGSVTAPLGFEISTTSGSGFTNSLTLTPDANGKIEQTIYVRFSPTQTNLHAGNIVHSSVGANNLNVNAEGLGFELDQVPGMALDLDGSSDRVDLGNPPELQITGDLTIQMWLKPTSFSQRRNPIGKAYGGEFTITQETNGKLTFYNGQSGYNGGSYQQISSDSSLVLNEWNHITIVRDISNTRWTWYLNGKLTNQSSMSNTSITAGNNSVEIGDGYLSGEFAGLIDEVRIWNTALSAQQVREKMHLTLEGNETGLVAYYQFNEPSGKAKDLINGLDGTFHSQATRSIATEPVGGGFSNTQTEIIGSVDFSNTDFTSDFISQNGAEVVASKLELSPNDTIGIGNGGTPADEQYWVVNRYGTGSYEANLTFTLSENLTSAEEAAPNTLKLYGRNNTSDGTWTFITNANNVIAATNEVTYNNVNTFEQYLITRNPFPKIIVENIDINFGNIDKDSTSSEMQYTVSASDLTANLIINAPSNFEISETSGSGYGSSITLTPSSGTIALDTIHVRFIPNSNSYFSGEISHTSTGAISRNISLDGTGVIPEIEVRQEATIIDNNAIVDFGSHLINNSNALNFSIKNKGLGTLTLSGSPKFTVSGTNASDFVVNEISTSTNLVQGETTYFKVIFTPSGNGTRTANISITNNDDDENPFIINLTGTGEALPNLLITSNLTPFSLLQTGSTSTSQSYTVSGNELLEDVVITTTSGFEISLNSGSEFSTDPIRLSHTNGNLSTTTIYVRFNPTSVTNYSGSILHTSNNATTKIVNISGESYQLAEITPGNALQFDGSDDYVLVNDANITFTDEATVEFWSNFEGTTSNTNSVIDIRDATNDRVFNVHFPWNGRIYFDAGNSDGYDRIYKSISIEEMTGWHHWAFVKDRIAGTMKIYRDGILWAEGTNKTRTFSLPQKIYIGKHNWSSNYFNGKLDEVRIWNTARTQQEIRENMHLTQLSTNVNLLGYYQFNENNFSSVYNIKAGSHGAMIGGERMTSTVPTGGGFSNTQTEMAGSVPFPTTNFETDFSAQNAAEVVVSRINLPPNITPTDLPRIFDAQYWAVHRYGTGAFTGDITFTVSEDLTLLDEATPSDIQLYGRGATTNTAWALIGTAAMVDADLNQATFTNISNFDQFFLASTTDGGDMDCQTNVYFENTIALADTTKSSTFIEAGNLTGMGDVTVMSGQTKMFQAPDIILKTGFIAQAGSDFTAKNDDCTPPAAFEVEPDNEIFIWDEKQTSNKKIAMTVFPNPSDTEFTIAFFLEEESKTSIELFDILGKRVSTILPEQNSAYGAHQINFVHHNLQNGTYVLVLQVEGEILHEKVVVKTRE